MKLFTGTKGAIGPIQFYSIEGYAYHTDDEHDGAERLTVHLTGKDDPEIDFCIHVNQYGLAMVELEGVTNMSMVEKSFGHAYEICEILGLIMVKDKESFCKDVLSNEIVACSAFIGAGKDGLLRFSPESKYHVSGFCEFLNDHTDQMCRTEGRGVTVSFGVTEKNEENLVNGIFGLYKIFCSSGMTNKVKWEDIARNGFGKSSL